ncbi:MAG: hypothetical protein U0452_01680 [Anaerolineae bacterium]
MPLSIRSARVQAVLVAAAAILLTAGYVWFAGSGFALDDAWIHQTYARNLGLYGEWAFVRGVPSAASTSPLFTVLLALGYRLGVPFELWTHTLGALALVTTGILGMWMARRLTRPDSLVPLAVGLACVGSWHLIWAAASGMETALFAAFTLALIVLAWRELDAQRPGPLVRAVIFGVAAGVTTLTRPEGIVLAGLCGLSLLLAHPKRPRRAMVLWLVVAALAWFVVMLPYVVLNLQLAGGLLPSTNAAKRAEYAVHFTWDFLTRLFYVLTPLAAAASILLVPGSLIYVWVQGRALGRKPETWLMLLPISWVVALPLLYALWLPVNYHYGRYVIPALPAFLVCGVVGTAWMLERSASSSIARPLARVLAVSAGVVMILFALILGPSAYKRGVTIINEEMVAQAQWIANHLPPGELLAVHDIGAVGYFAPRAILDTAGLVSSEVIPVLHDKEGLYALFEAQRVRYFMGFDDQTPGADPADPRLCPLRRSVGTASTEAGGSSMTIYSLAYDGVCP